MSIDKASQEDCRLAANRFADLLLSIGASRKSVLDFAANDMRIFDHLIGEYFLQPDDLAGVDASIIPFPIPQRFKAADTDLDQAIALSEKFAKEVLGVDVDLRKQFNIPAELPWQSVLLVFDPCLDNRQAVDLALTKQGIDHGEEENVDRYTGSEARHHPTLHIIENSITPTASTLISEPKTLFDMDTENQPYLGLRDYILAFGQRHFGFKDYLDVVTMTWFPKNRTPRGWVARGYWFQLRRRLMLGYSPSVRFDLAAGARLVISVPPRYSLQTET